MAAEVVGGAFLSAFLQVLFDRLASPGASDFVRNLGLSDELRYTLQDKLVIVHKVINDAEVKQIWKPDTERWLDRVKDTVYGAEDLLDEIATEVLRSQIEGPGSSNWLLNSQFASWFKTLGNGMGHRVKGMIADLKSILEEKDFWLIEADVHNQDESWLPRQTTSLMDECLVVYGMDESKDTIVNLLLSDNADGNKIDVISIVGMGGCGKTTLAKLVYHDERVNRHLGLEDQIGSSHFDFKDKKASEHFDLKDKKASKHVILKAWVCVSEDFLVLRITKSILNGIGCATPSDLLSSNLDSLQFKLKESLRGKKFLLVLDDVWSIGCREWDLLRLPLPKGSKVLMTTRDENVATTMRSVYVHHLTGLSEADSWNLFRRLAFVNGDSSQYPDLESIGRDIVPKCGGLPLAINALGRLLYSKTETSEWKQILDSEIWYLETDVLPSLILSYQGLPLQLKRCFAYCSIFPKAHEFDKENLILLWMAEGFLRLRRGMERIEEVGESHFHQLLSKSFFQKSVAHDLLFVMHDLIHDLAKLISGKSCVRLDDTHEVQNISKTTRHSLYFENTGSKAKAPFKRFEALTEGKGLRTLLELKFECGYQINKRVGLHNMLPEWRYLRVLSLQHYKNIDLPRSIGQLKHLRYLNLSFTMIKRLPDSVCDLYNLQTLLLSGISSLVGFPTRMDKLINLRYLDVSGCGEMPSHIGKLTRLQKLSEFIVGPQEHGVRISELKEISEIRGKLEISRLENVVNAVDALKASMKDKKHLDELSLIWSSCVGEGNETDQILETLQAHAISNLKKLNITNSPCLNLRDWGRNFGLLNLLSLELDGCRNLLRLPSLGRLPRLNYLRISGMENLETVGIEFYGYSDLNFPSLQTLIFCNMERWTRWENTYSSDALSRRDPFPCLQKLCIRDCPYLAVVEVFEFSSLKTLEIHGCGGLYEVCYFNVPNIRELKMKNYGDFWLIPGTDLRTSDIEICKMSQWDRIPFEPESLSIMNTSFVESLLEYGLQKSPTSLTQNLQIWNCSFFRYLQIAPLPNTLKSLDISECTNLRFLLPVLFGSRFPSLEQLTIHSSQTADTRVPLSFLLNHFPRLIHFSMYGPNDFKSLSISISEREPTSLQSLRILGCDDLEMIELPVLDSACYEILQCSKLTVLTLTVREPPTSLRSLRIQFCNDLENIELPALGSACYEILHCCKLRLLTLTGREPASLRSLRLEYCPQLSLQIDGLLSNLQELEVCDCDRLAPLVNLDLQTLVSLTELKIRGGCGDVESFPVERLLPSTLTSLVIEDFPNLRSLDGGGLQQLTSLAELSICRCPELKSLTESGLPQLTSLNKLHIFNCPKLQYLAKERLPASLSFLTIEGCPLLEQRCLVHKGKEWDYMAHIPQILINDVLF